MKTFSNGERGGAAQPHRSRGDRSLHSTVRCGLAPRLIPAWISVCGLFSFDNHVHLVAGSVKPTMSFQGRLFNLLDEGSTTTTSTKTRTDSRRTFLVLPRAPFRPKPTTLDRVPSAPGLFRCEHGFMNHCGGILLGRPSTWMSVLWSYADARMLSRISPLLASAEGKSDPRTPTGAPVQHKVTRRLPTDGRGLLGAGFRALKPRSSGYKALKPLAIKPSILWRSSPQFSGDQALNTQTSQLCAALFCVASQCTR